MFLLMSLGVKLKHIRLTILEVNKMTSKHDQRE